MQLTANEIATEVDNNYDIGSPVNTETKPSDGFGCPALPFAASSFEVSGRVLRPKDLMSLRAANSRSGRYYHGPHRRTRSVAITPMGVVRSSVRNYRLVRHHGKP